MIQSKGEKVFSVVNYIILGLCALAAVYPVWYVLVSSLSGGREVLAGKVFLWPVNPTLDAYEKVFSNTLIWRSYINAIYVTFAGTLVSMVITVCGAYSLSKKRLYGRNVFSFFIAFTMWFNAGMIPLYLNFRELHMLNSLWGVIIGFAISTFNVILMRTYFQTNVPESLEEAAKIDGASDFAVLAKIYLPIAKPALATIALYYAVARWNTYFWPMIMITDENKTVLQVLLKKLIVEMDVNEEMMNRVDVTLLAKDTVIYAIIIASVIPVMLFYPFMQKYFVSGITVGSVKG